MSQIVRSETPTITVAQQRNPPDRLAYRLISGRAALLGVITVETSVGLCIFLGWLHRTGSHEAPH
jgi:hypothetical protein